MSFETGENRIGDLNGRAWVLFQGVIFAAEKEPRCGRKGRVVYPYSEAGHQVPQEWNDVDDKIKAAFIEKNGGGFVGKLWYADKGSAAAAALRAVPSEVRSRTAQENGKKGGRPRKI